MDKLQEQLNKMMSQVDELETRLNEREDTISQLEMKLSELSMKFAEHRHTDFDGSQYINNTIPKIADSFDYVSVGDGGFFSGTRDGSSQLVMCAGEPDAILRAEQSGTDFGASQIVLVNNGLGSNNSFFAAAGVPQLQFGGSGIDISSSGSTIGSGSILLKGDNSLAGCTILVFSQDYSTIIEKEIASNTESTITIHGTWGTDISNAIYQIYKPVLLGTTIYRWKSLSLSGEDFSESGTQYTGITMGRTDNAVSIQFGDGAPTHEANNGTIYLRRDGTPSSSLYIRVAGTWRAR